MNNQYNVLINPNGHKVEFLMSSPDTMLNSSEVPPGNFISANTAIGPLLNPILPTKISIKSLIRYYQLPYYHPLAINDPYFVKIICIIIENVFMHIHETPIVMEIN